MPLIREFREFRLSQAARFTSAVVGVVAVACAVVMHAPPAWAAQAAGGLAVAGRAAGDARSSLDGPGVPSGAAVASVLSAVATAAESAAASSDARLAMQWVQSTGDNNGLPYAIVDKKGGAIWVFDAEGQLRGNSAALLGLTPGDGSTPGMQQRKVSSLRADERTTPAGRFVTEPGRNLQGEPIIWIDYQAKLAIHRLRPAVPGERRAVRLASGAAGDRRISFGCVVVPVAFYEGVIAPVLGKGYGVVYVLPETQPVQSLLGALQLSQR